MAIYKVGEAQPEGLLSKSEEAPYEIAVVNSPTLILPYELMVEIFDWHMLMGGRRTTALLVCKRWTTVAYSSPRLWSRISVTNSPRYRRCLRGSVICTDLDHLRLVLSRSGSCPLQVALSFLSNTLPLGNESISSASLVSGP